MKKSNPPRWAITFLRWFCNDHLSDAVLGDLLEMYDRRRARLGKFKADILFTWNVVQFVQPFAIRKKTNSSSINRFDMIGNYLKMASRNMSRHKMYTAITIGGFALGLATCMVIFLFIRNELSYDKNYKDGDRIFRLYNWFEAPGDRDRWSNIQTPLAGVIKQELPDVELVARLMPYRMGKGNSNLLRRDDAIENTYEERFAYADPELPELLEIPMVFGNTKALDKPFTMIISRRKSLQYFGDNDPTGKVMIIGEDKTQPYTVAGVMDDFSTNSHFQFDFLLTLKGYEFWPGEQTDWCCWNYNTYLKLREGVNPIEFQKKLLPIRDNYLVFSMRQKNSQDADRYAQYHTFRLQPVGDIYLQRWVSDENKHGDLTYVWLFGGIAVFILLLACINFINLSTARSANRAKEVGLRKVVGSLRKYLVAQFLTESTLYSLISFVIAFLILLLTLPGFNVVASRSLTIPWTSWWLFPSLFAAALVIGIIAGMYPAFYLSAFKPINVLKGNLRQGSKSGALRSGMVIFQFTASIILIVGTLVVYRQMNFMMSRDVGFDKDQVMIIEGTSTLGDRAEAFRNELMKLSDVENVSITGYLPVTGANREGYAFFNEGKEKEDQSVNAQKWRVDAYYISTMRMKIVDGRDFDVNMISDSNAVIVNQAMARELGLKEPIGHRITNGTIYTIVGVVEDFNYNTMRAPIRPLCFVIEGGRESATAVRIKSPDLPTAIQSIAKTWSTLMPGQPFRYAFLDERFARMYDEILQTGRIFAGFSTLAIFVACLGLFALSAFMTEQRAKEISIRFVMGASTGSVFQLLTGNFMKLVLISWVIGTPLAWYGMNKWLEDYTFREPISSNVFMIAGVIAASIALITVSYQSVKAAMTRPVENLRRE